MIAGYLTSEELRAHAGMVAVIPYGAMEQHGPWLPLLTDTLIAEHIAVRVEEAHPTSVMLFPSIWLGDSMEHAGFAGTMSLNLATSMAMLQKLFDSLLRSGFRRAILYNAHGGNIHLANALCEEYSRGSDLKVLSVYAYSGAVRKLSKELFGSSLSHGGSSELSLLAYLQPSTIRTDGKPLGKAAPYPGDIEFKTLPTEAFAPKGAIDTNIELEADPEKGEQLVEAMKVTLYEAVEGLLRIV